MILLRLCSIGPPMAVGIRLRQASVSAPADCAGVPAPSHAAAASRTNPRERHVMVSPLFDRPAGRSCNKHLWDDHPAASPSVNQKPLRPLFEPLSALHNGAGRLYSGQIRSSMKALPRGSRVLRSSPEPGTICDESPLKSDRQCRAISK